MRAGLRSRYGKSQEIGSIFLTTTLYHLIEAVQEEVGPEEDALVTEIVSDLLHSGKVSYKGTLKSEDLIEHEGDLDFKGHRKVMGA